MGVRPYIDLAAPRDPPAVSLFMPGKPEPKHRHRDRIVFPKGYGKQPFVHRYPDPRSEKYELELSQFAREQMGRIAPLEGPLQVVVTAYVPIPESWSGRKRMDAAGGLIRPTGKPDADNYGKVIDALNGVVWIDDAQVVDTRAVKFYSEDPGLRIDVWLVTTGLI